MRPVSPEVAVRDGCIDPVATTIPYVPVDITVVPWEVDIQDTSTRPIGFDDAGILARQFCRVTITPERYREFGARCGRMGSQGQSSRTTIVRKRLAELSVGPRSPTNACNVVVIAALVGSECTVSFVERPMGEEIIGTR